MKCWLRMGVVGLIVAIAPACSSKNHGNEHGETSGSSGGAANGGAANGVSSGGASSNGGATNGGAANGVSSGGASSNGGATNGGESNGGGMVGGGAAGSSSATANGGKTGSGGASGIDASGGESGATSCGRQAPLAGTWTKTNWSGTSSFFKLSTSQGRVFCRTWDALNGGRTYVAASGTDWTQIGSADNDIDILSVVKVDGNLLAGTWNGFYVSSSDPISWNAVTPAGVPADSAIWSLATVGTTLLAGGVGTVFRSSDNGGTWAGASSGIPANAVATSFAVSGNAVFAGTDSNGVFTSADSGATWTAVNSGLANAHISQVAAIGSRLFAVTLTGVFVSDDHGASWAADASGIKNVNSLLVLNNQLLAGTDDSGTSLSVDSGKTWTAFRSGLPDSTRVWSLAASSDSVFAGTNAGVFRVSCEN